LCISLNNNHPYKDFKCFDSFVIQAQSVSVKYENGCDKAITVDWENSNPSNGDYIALYKGWQTIHDNLSFYLYTCSNSQDNQDCLVGSEEISGSITFDVTDPDAEENAQWPPPQGKYEACLGTVNNDGDDEIITCEDMKINGSPKKALNGLTLTMKATSYPVDEAIIAEFSTVRPIRNSWAGIYSGEPTSGTEIPGPLMWVYLGCNNQQGDQTENNDCSVKRKSGSLQIDETSTERSEKDWPLEAGTYHLCISLNNNSPYNDFKCFDSFVIQAQSVSVKYENGYDKAITVDWENSNPSNGDYIALYKGWQTIHDNLSFYLYTCSNSQDNQDCLVGLETSGSITFDVTDPDAEENAQWPPPQGKYKACLGTVNNDGDDEIITCEDMKINRSPKNARDGLTLTMKATSYTVDEAIIADFSTERPIRNSWAGIYSGEPTSGTEIPDEIPEPLMWVYLGCNNQQGDQIENNDCSVKRRSGSLQIDETSTERSGRDWPLEAGTYHLCISLNNNHPYKDFKCFDSFVIGSILS